MRQSPDQTDWITRQNLNRWRPYIRQALNLEHHTEVYVPKPGMPHPLDSGFYSSAGLGEDHQADYRLRLKDGRGIHVQEYDHEYRLHWDKIDPSWNPIGHLLADAPEVAGIAAVLGAVFLPALLDS